MYFRCHAAALAPEMFPERQWLLITSGKLTIARKKQIEKWREQVNFLEVVTL